jgi:hypothetical protein
MASDRYVFRAKNFNPPAEQPSLARSLIKILQSGTHGLCEIVQAMNQSPVRLAPVMSSQAL